MAVAIDQKVIDTLRLSAIDAAAAALQEREKKDFEQNCVRKPDNSWVTPGDKEAQKAVIKEIKASGLPKELSQAAILGEEDEHGNAHAPAKATEYRWVIDPVDGTSNFIRGRPVAERKDLPSIDVDKPEIPQKRFAVSIALQHRNDQGAYNTVAGAVFCLDADASAANVTGDLYWSDANSAHLMRIQEGKFRQKFQLMHGQVAQNVDSEHHRMLTGPVQPRAALGSFPEDNQGTLQQTFQAELTKSSHVIDTVPCACVAMMDVIEGKSDAYVHGKHFAWDSAAAGDILRKAGIWVEEFRFPGHGNLPEHQQRSTVIAARAPEMYQALNDAYNGHYLLARELPQLLYAHNPPSQRAQNLSQDVEAQR